MAPRVEVDWNTSTVAMRVVEDDVAILLGDLNTGTWSSRLGVGCKDGKPAL
jgi:hypothetical protein